MGRRGLHALATRWASGGDVAEGVVKPQCNVKS